MPTNQPTPAILDDAALEEIEARPYYYVGLGRRVELHPDERDALCATVRVLKQANKDLAADTVRLTNEGHKAHDRWQSELWQTEQRLKTITEDRNRLLTERDEALQRLRVHENDKTPANTEYEL